jgi:hypothetical protein
VLRQAFDGILPSMFVIVFFFFFGEFIILFNSSLPALIPPQKNTPLSLIFFIFMNTNCFAC